MSDIIKANNPETVPEKSEEKMKNRIITSATAVLLFLAAALTAAAKSTSVGNVTVGYGTPVVDGSFSNGEYVTVITLDGSNLKAFDQFEQKTVPDGFSMKLYLSWDGDGLYVGYSVTDPTPISAESGWKFNGDLIQFFVDPGPTVAGNHTTDEAAIGRRAPLFTTGMDTDGTLFYLHQCVPSEAILNNVPDGDYRFAGRITDNGWDAEFMIPWKMLTDDINTKVAGAALSPEGIGAGTSIGLMAIYNDFSTNRALVGWYASTNTSDSDPFDWQPEIFGINAVLGERKDGGAPETSDALAVAACIMIAGTATAVLCLRRKTVSD